MMSVLQNDGVAMVELEGATITSLTDKRKLWKNYVDDTIAFAKTDATKNVSWSLNSYHGKIQFTMEIKQNNQNTFVDVQLLIVK